jgi:glycolate oxidase FAD binding subunit
MGLTTLELLVEEVGPADPVVARGGDTQSDIGPPVDASARLVRPPSGIVEHEPAEMTVRVLAGTLVTELDAALRTRGQCVALPTWPGATVGGVLAVGRSGIRRLGWGPVRDTVLELRYVSAEGRLVKGGGPTVKNVSGYDLPRLFVGSLGTLGVIADVVLRTRPVPAHEQWFRADGVDPFALQRCVHRPAAVLWDGTVTWVLLDGHPADIEETARVTGLAGGETGHGPVTPQHRWTVAPATLPAMFDDGRGPFVAEVGVGVAHRTVPQPPTPLSEPVRTLHARIKSAFDPAGRMAPGRKLW